MLSTDKMYEYRVLKMFAVLSNYLFCYPLFITFKGCLFIHPLDCAGLLTYKLLWNDNIKEHLKEI